MESSTSPLTFSARPCSIHVYQETPTPARSATSSRRNPVARRLPDMMRPTSRGVSEARLAVKNLPSSMSSAGTAVRPCCSSVITAPLCDVRVRYDPTDSAATGGGSCGFGNTARRGPRSHPRSLVRSQSRCQPVIRDLVPAGTIQLRHIRSECHALLRFAIPEPLVVLDVATHRGHDVGVHCRPWP